MESFLENDCLSMSSRVTLEYFYRDRFFISDILRDRIDPFFVDVSVSIECDLLCNGNGDSEFLGVLFVDCEEILMIADISVFVLLPLRVKHFCFLC